MEAMLEACGEKGYRNASVQDVIDRYGGNRVQFYRNFGSKAECYSEAYETGIETLCKRLLDAGGAEPEWRRGLRAALAELACFVQGSPLAAKGLLIEVHVAGGSALEKRAEVCDRLVRALDGARRESGSGEAPPEVTARFMVGAIESSAAGALARGAPGDFAESIPELAHLIVAAYFGEKAAKEELALSAV
jgi:AcrR family transcriptional regulator